MDRSSSAETASIEEITSKSRLLVPPTLSLPLTIQHPTIYPRSALLQNLGLLSDPNLTSALTASILHQNALAPQLQNPLLGFQNRVPLWNPLWPKTRRKGGQVRFTTEQTNSLEERFDTDKYLSPQERRKLAEDLDLSERQVKTWFQNRRAKWRRQKSEDSPDEGPNVLKSTKLPTEEDNGSKN